MPSKPFIECPACGFGSEVSEAAIGRRARCPECKTTFVIRPLQPVSDPEEPPQRDEPVRAEERIEEDVGEPSREKWGKTVTEAGLLDQISPAARWGLEKLGKYREYTLRQESEFDRRNSLLEWDDPNWYDVRGPLGTVAVVAEERGGFWDGLIRTFGEAKQRRLCVLDKSMTEVLLEIDRSSHFMASEMEVRVATGDRRLGRVQRHFHPILKTYELSGASGEIFAAVRAPIWRWRYSIRDPTREKELGVIRKKLFRSLNESSTLGDSFAIDFGGHDWKLEQRWILLAATVAIDLDSFEPKKVHWVPSG